MRGPNNPVVWLFGASLVLCVLCAAIVALLPWDRSGLSGVWPDRNVGTPNAQVPPPLAPEPRPRWLAAMPHWPGPADDPPETPVSLPAPALDLELPRISGDEGLVEPAPSRVPRAPTPGRGDRAAFARHLLRLRRSGLELVLVVEDAPQSRRAAWKLATAVKAMLALFPGARVGLVVYSGTGMRVLGLGTLPEQIRQTLDSPLPRVRAAAEATGLARAMVAATRMAWRPKGRAVLAVLPSRPPWIAEVPPAQDAARRFRRNRQGSTYVLCAPSSGGADDISTMDRLCADEAVSRVPVPSADVAHHKLLALILGDAHKDRIPGLIHVLAN